MSTSIANAVSAVAAASVQPNSRAAVEARAAQGRISWTGPLLLVAARSVLLIVSQALTALILLALHRPSPWRAAGDWWTVYGTLVDIGCLLGMRCYTRREGLRMRDLIGPIRLRRGAICLSDSASSL
jgi:hypothetical protein